MNLKFKESKISLLWKVVNSFGALVMFTFAVYILSLFFQRSEYSILSFSIAISFAGIFIWFSIKGVIDTFSDKIIFEDKKIRFVKYSKNIVLPISNIESYYIGGDSLYIISKTRNRPYEISSHFDNFSDIRSWFESNFRNEIEERIGKDKVEILNNEKYGFDASDRSKELEQSSNWSKAYSIIGFLLCLLIIIYPKPYSLILGIGILFPIFGIVLIILSKGLIQIGETKGKAYPSIVSGIASPIVAIFLRGLLDYDIYDLSKLMIYTLIMSLMATIVLYHFIKALNEYELSIIGIISNVIILMFYSYGVLVHINCNYDFSNPKIIRTSLVDKRETSGNNVSYYFIINPSDFDGESEEFSVDRNQYHSTKIGDEIGVNLNEGRIGISWVYISD